ncbi:MAG TPA: class I tRNA ligase family protein, partial [Candidatus Paceibacterota bacterium]|nr:class I tRNA ligase family protein [Candidatus Paceibacterota bacterium]
EFNLITKDITSDMDNFRFYLAGEKLYAYVWHRLADEVIEESKNKADYSNTLYYILENSLKLLHPFMPFVTEEIWLMIPNQKDTLLMVEKWPIKNVQ